MDPNIIQAISTVLTDAIKILGPAIITGFIGLKVGKYQLEIKLKEIEQNNRFKAREHLFQYYKDLQTTIREKHENLISSLATLTGMASAVGDKPEDSLSSLMYNFFSYYIKSAPQDISLILRDFEKHKKQYHLEYELLSEYKSKSEKLIIVTNIDDLGKTISELLEIYGHLNRCAHLLVEEQAKYAFKPYLEPE